MRIRILLTDDHTIILEGLSRFVREQDDMEVMDRPEMAVPWSSSAAGWNPMSF